MNTLSQYIESIKDIPVLTREEEQKLARDKTEESRQKLINSNLKLVVSIAKDYAKKYHMNIMDLIQEGNIGLIIAIDRFNPDKGFKISTYAIWWIKHKIIKAIRNKKHEIRIPEYIYERVKKIAKTQKEMDFSFGRKATINEIADKLNTTKEQISFYLSCFRNLFGIKDSLNGTDQLIIEDILKIDMIEEIEEKIASDQLTNLLDEIFSDYDSRTRDIISMLFGIGDGKPKTLEEVGNMYGLCRERIRQIKNHFFQSLRNKKTTQRKKELWKEGRII